jgi:hypothetical protein
MKVCAKHQEMFVRDIINTVDLYAVDGVISQLMLLRVNGDEFGWNPFVFKETVEVNGGCPICFMDKNGSSFYDEVVKIVNNHEYRIGGV